MDLAALGITTRKVAQFKSKGIESAEDLLYFIPRKYNDFREPVKRLTPDHMGQVIALVGVIKDIHVSQSGTPRLTCTLYTSGNTVTLTWFGQTFLYSRIDYYASHSCEVLVCGKLDYSLYAHGYQMTAPIMITDNIKGNLRLQPVYSKIQGMSDDYLQASIQKALTTYNEPEQHSKELMTRFKLRTLKSAFQCVHAPQDTEDIREGKQRLIFDALYAFATEMLKEEAAAQNSAFCLKEMRCTAEKIRNLPYTLTNDQINTVRSIAKTAKKGNRINALLQGDVGCGKTIVAFLAMLLFAENGYQSVLMAPTQVLAEQHAKGIEQFLVDTPFADRFVFLRSKLKAKEKREALARIKSGEALFIVGTHAVLGSSVEYKHLALTIADEEHKFGVAQRTALTEKSDAGVHSITMSATPIPRSIAQTIYGESKTVYSIMQMPNGRQPVKTLISKNDQEVFNALIKQVNRGHQAYIVFPVISESSSEKMKGVEAVKSFYASYEPWFEAHNIRAGCLTGQNTAEETSGILSAFENGTIQVLCATTVVEVGVNVPNATLIIIRNAERFGLAQLHQLRGRVGRSDKQSYCILCSENAAENERLQILCSTNNGFKIAMEDLKLRGSGDLIGLKQSGNDENVKLMLAYPQLYDEIKAYIRNM